MNTDYFAIPEEKYTRRDSMVVLDVRLDNFYAFRNFHMNLTYPKKIVGSSIKDEYLPGHSNFRYKKINIIMGANASGKTTFGHALMDIFNFLDKKNYEKITSVISNKLKPAYFRIDMASKYCEFYRVTCEISPCVGDKYKLEDIHLEIRKGNIWTNDSYESCVKRILGKKYTPADNYLEEIENMGDLDWLFEYPEDTLRMLRFPKQDIKFLNVLENILKALDPSIRMVEASKDVENAYVIRLQDKSVILQDGEPFTTKLLSSGTKAGVEVARVISSLMQGFYSFCYCDEKFPYVHTDIEKAILSLMIDFIGPGEQLFFTTHNTDILDMDLPKHSFTFLRKDPLCNECPITCIDASSLLERNTDSLKNAVENDLFSSAPALDRIYEIADL